MYYALSILSTVLLSLEFALNKKYQSLAGTSLRAGLRFNMLSGMTSAVIMLALTGFRPQWSGFSLVMSLAMTLCGLTYSLLSFKVLKLGGMALYSTFLMSGGMLLPYLFGILFLEEQLTPLRLAGVAVILAAVVLSNFSTQKLNRKLLLLCAAVFVLNGTVSILSKCHQVTTAYPSVSSSAFVMYSGIWKWILSGLMLLFFRTGHPTAKKKGLSLGVALGAAAIGAASYLLQLIGATALPASVLYPIVTGGSILFSALAGRVFFREQISRRQLLSIILCFIGTLLFL